MKITPIVLICLLYSVVGYSQHAKVHSHNDYDQRVPFWKAFYAGANSIEADIFLKDGVLYVTHAEDEIIEKRTLEKLYLKPLNSIYGQTSTEDKVSTIRSLQILIDIKSEALSSLDALIHLLSDYPALTLNENLRFVISGSRPNPTQYYKYPDYIWFDYQDLEPLSDRALNKVALISMSFKKFSQWNGKGTMEKVELDAIKQAIKKAHGYQKPFRFWATPDTQNTWGTMIDLGVDFINTDRPGECVEFVISREE